MKMNSGREKFCIVLRVGSNHSYIEINTTFSDIIWFPRSGLHLAVIHGHNDAVGKLLEYGASRDRPVGERQNR